MSRYLVIYRESADAAPKVYWFDCGELALAAWLETAQKVHLGRWHCAVSASTDGGINDRANLRPHAAQELVRVAIAEFQPSLS